MKHSSIKISTILKINKKLLLLCLATWGIAGCGSAQNDLVIARKNCRTGSEMLKRRIGPEFSKFVSLTPLPISQSQFGCAFVYTKILEELPGEVQGSYISATEPHELAFVIPDFEGRLLLNQASIPKFRQGAVEILVKLAEIHGGSPPEVLVEERDIGSQSSIYSMRIFMYAEGVPAPKEIFSERLSTRLDNGLEQELEWLTADLEGLPAIILKNKSNAKEKVYMWHESLQSYQYDLAVTQRRALSPNASQLRLSSGKDLRPKKIVQLQNNSQLPKSLVPVIDTSKDELEKTEDQTDQMIDQLSTQTDQVKDQAKRNLKSAPTPNSPQKKGEQVTTVNEFLEGL
jgi:hypothetical protein